MKSYFAVIPLVLSLCACDSPPPANERAPNPILDPQTHALKKAQAIEGQLKDADEARRKPLDSADQ